MMMDELWDDYFLFLISEYGLNNRKGRSRSKLLEMLHNIPFRYIIERDENRAADGQELRNHYLIPDEYEEYSEEFMNRDCSVFEMLIALAVRMDDEYVGDPSNPLPEEMFWEMIRNLDLYDIININFDNVKIINIVNRWLDRDFTKKGRGSIFPIYGSDFEDQREIEIWDQMNAYIYENYV